MQLHCWSQERPVLNEFISSRILTKMGNYESLSIFILLIFGPQFSHFYYGNNKMYFACTCASDLCFHCSALPLFLFFSPVWPTCAPQQLYTELSQCYQTLISSEAQLRQSHQELSGLLAQKDKDILELQAQIQQQQLQQQQRDQMHMLQQSRHTAPCAPLHRQTNFKVICNLTPSPFRCLSS